MQNLLFDLDGTLIDSSEGIRRSLEYAMEKLGIPLDSNQDLSWCIGPPLADSLKIILGPTHEHLVPDGVKHYRARYGEIGMHENSVYPGTREMLQQVKEAGHRLFIATSKPQAFAVPILERLSLDSYFIGIYGAGLDGTLGTKADLIRHIMSIHGLESNHTWMIGDRKHDIIGAEKNGLRSIGVLWGFGSKVELENAGATRICQNQSGLSALLS